MSGQRHVLAIHVVAVFVAFSLGCAAASKPDGAIESPPSTLWVVLVDKSASSKADKDLYADTIRRLVAGVQPGDRFVMAVITAASGADFRHSIDHAVPPPPPPQGSFDEPRKYRQEKAARDRDIADARAAIEKGAQNLLTVDAGAPRTAIFESLLVIAPQFASDKRRPVLVLLSDMMEDSGAVNFERSVPTDDFTKREIARQQQSHTLPLDLLSFLNRLRRVRLCLNHARREHPLRLGKSYVTMTRSITSQSRAA